MKSDLYEVSSTEIRKALLSAGESLLISRELSAGVYGYIIENDLYGYVETLKAKVLPDLRKNLSEDRYEHTLSVMDTAKELSERFGYNVNKAVIAAMLHDTAKEKSAAELNDICKKASKGLDKYSKDSVNLLHGPAASYIIREKYGVIDEEISRSIYYHTTGYYDMGTLEKIIFIADKIEPLNDFDGINDIRTAAECSLDEAMILLLERGIKRVKDRAQTLHPLQTKALKYYRDREKGS